MSDDLRFRVEDDSSSDLFSKIVKSLLILILLLAVVLLAVWGYRLIFDKEATPKKVVKNTPKKHIVSTQQVKKQPRALNKEELAMIIKAVMIQMQKEQQKNKKATKTATNKPHKTSTDSQLLNSLQKAKIDTIKTKPKKVIEKKEIKKLAKKKIKEKIIKKKIVYNAVIIGKKEIKNTNDLAKLYASINRISKKKKRRILNSAYTKKIKKEIIIRKNSMRTIRVRQGDTLSSIALRAYGKSSLYNKIFEANPDLLSNPNNLRVGQVLRVPK